MRYGDKIILKNPASTCPLLHAVEEIWGERCRLPECLPALASQIESPTFRINASVLWINEREIGIASDSDVLTIAAHGNRT